MKNEIIWTMNIILIGLLIGNIGVLPVSPKDEMETFERDILFEWSGVGKEYQVMVDDNKEFTSPITRSVTGNTMMIENIEPGEYYWKIRKNGVESPVRNFEIKSRVGLDLVRNEEEILLKNSGNVDEVMKARNPITGEAVIDIPYGGSIMLNETQDRGEFIAVQK